MASERPVLLVDIDGVLNVWGVDECPPGYREHRVFAGDEEPLRLADVHGGWLGELAGRFEVTWVSGWGHEAHEVLGPLLGLARFPFVPMPAIPFDPDEKLPAVEAYLGERTAAWVDDYVSAAMRGWEASRAAPTRIVEVDHRVGLTRVQVDELLAWAEGVGDRG